MSTSDIPIAQSAILEEAQRKTNESEALGINLETNGSGTPVNSGMRYLTSVNIPLVWPCSRPKQGNQIGGYQSDAFLSENILNIAGELQSEDFHSEDILNSAGKMSTSSLSSLSQDTSNCSFSLAAVPCTTMEDAHKNPKEELDRTVMDSDFVCDSISDITGKGNVGNAEAIRGSKTEDAHIGRLIFGCTREEIDAVVGLIYKSGGEPRDACSSKMTNGSNLRVNPQGKEMCSVYDGDSSCKEVEGRDKKALCGYTSTHVTDGRADSTVNSTDNVHRALGGNVQCNLDDMVRDCTLIDYRCSAESGDYSQVRRNCTSDDVISGDDESDGKVMVDYSMLGDICNDTQRNYNINNQTNVNSMEVRGNLDNIVAVDTGSDMANYMFNSTRKVEVDYSAASENSLVLGIKSNVITSSNNANQNSSKSSKGVINYERVHQTGKNPVKIPQTEILRNESKEMIKSTSEHDPACLSDSECAETSQYGSECIKAIQGTSKCNVVLQSDSNCDEIIGSVCKCDQTLPSWNKCAQALQGISRFNDVLKSDSICDVMHNVSKFANALSGKDPLNFGECSMVESSRYSCGVDTNEIVIERNAYDMSNWGTVDSVFNDNPVSVYKFIGSSSHRDNVCCSRKGMETEVTERKHVSLGQDEMECSTNVGDGEDSFSKNRDCSNVHNGETLLKSGNSGHDVDENEVSFEVKHGRNGQYCSLRDCDGEDNRVAEDQVTNEVLLIAENSESGEGKAYGVESNVRVLVMSSSDSVHEKNMFGQSKGGEGRYRNCMKGGVIHKSDCKEWELKDNDSGSKKNGISRIENVDSKIKADGSRIENGDGAGNEDDDSGFEKGYANGIEKEDGNVIEKGDTENEDCGSAYEKEDGSRNEDDVSGVKNGDRTGVQKYGESRIKMNDGRGIQKDAGIGIEDGRCRIEKDIGTGIEDDDCSGIGKVGGNRNFDKKDIKKFDKIEGNCDEYGHASIEGSDSEVCHSVEKGKIPENCVFYETVAMESTSLVTNEKDKNDKMRTFFERKDSWLGSLTGTEHVSDCLNNLQDVCQEIVGKGHNVLNKGLKIVEFENVQMKTSVNEDGAVNRKMELDKLDSRAESNKVDTEDRASDCKMELKGEAARDSVNFDNRASGQETENSKGRIVLEELMEVKSSGTYLQEGIGGNNIVVNVDLKGDDETADNKLEGSRELIFSGTRNLDEHASSRGANCSSERMNSVKNDSKTGLSDKLEKSDCHIDKLGIYRDSNSSYEEPEILRGLSSPSYEPEIILDSGSPDEETEICRGWNNPSDEFCRGSGKDYEISDITRGVESTKRKRNSYENRSTGETLGKLYRLVDDTSLSSHRQSSHYLDVIINMLNTVKKNVLSLEQQMHQGQEQESRKAAEHRLQELREFQVMQHVKDHTLTTQEDLSSKYSVPVKVSSHESQVKGKDFHDKSHLQECLYDEQMECVPHAQKKKKYFEKTQMALKPDRNRQLSEDCQTEGRPSCSAEDVLHSPSAVQEHWKRKEIKTSSGYTKLLSKVMQQLQKLKQSAQAPSFKIQELVYQLYVGIQEQEENAIEEQHLASHPKKQHLIQKGQQAQWSLLKKAHVHQQGSCKNQKDSEHKLEPCSSVQQRDKDFWDENKKKMSEEVTELTQMHNVDGELCNFAPDLSVGSLLSEERQKSVSILKHEEVIETDCVSTLLKRMEKGTDLFYGSGNSNHKSQPHKDDMKDQSLALPKHQSSNQSEITILSESVRSDEPHMNYCVPKRISSSIGRPEVSPAAKKQKNFDVSMGKPTVIQKKNLRRKARQVSAVTCAGVNDTASIRPVYRVALGSNKTFSLPSWAMSGVHFSEPSVIHAQPSVRIFPPQGCKVVPADLQALCSNVGIAAGMKPWLKKKPSHGRTYDVPTNLPRSPSSAVKKSLLELPSIGAHELRSDLSTGPPFYKSVRRPTSKQRIAQSQPTPSSSCVYDKNQTVTQDQKILLAVSGRKKKDAVSLP